MHLHSPWKKDFAFLAEHLQGDVQPCHYLDSAATCLVPEQVVKANTDYLRFSHANSHRGFYPLSAQLTERIEQVRQQVADFINAQSAENLIFTSSTTAAIHQIVQGYFTDRTTTNSNIIVSVAEHHANFLPWQQLATDTGAELRVLPIDEHGQADLTILAEILDAQTVVIAINHLSNVLGTVNPIAKITGLAKKFNAKVVVDGAQFAAHHQVDIQALGCDFYVFSGHKLYGGNGIGVLYTSPSCMAEMQPVVLGGGMASYVDTKQSTWLSGNRRFEAGTMNSQAIISLASALDYLESARANDAKRYLQQLSAYLYQQLSRVTGVNLLLPQVKGTSIISFTVDNIHSHDIASILAEHNVAVRAGHHCAQPLHKQLDKKSSIRVSLGLYNDSNDIDALIAGLVSAQRLLG